MRFGTATLDRAGCPPLYRPDDLAIADETCPSPEHRVQQEARRAQSKNVTWAASPPEAMAPEGLGSVASVSTLDIRRLQRRRFLPDSFYIRFHVVSRTTRVTSFAGYVHRKFSSWLLSTRESSLQARWTYIFESFTLWVVLEKSGGREEQTTGSAVDARWAGQLFPFGRVLTSGSPT